MTSTASNELALGLAVRSSQSRTTIMDLPNETLDRITAHCGRSDWLALAHTHSRFLPWARKRLLAVVFIAPRIRLTQLLRWADAAPLEQRRWVKAVVVKPVVPFTDDKVNQHEFARLLRLLPAVEWLDIGDWPSTTVLRRVVEAFGALAKLKHFGIAIKTSDEPEEIMLSVLHSLPAGLHLRTLHLGASPDSDQPLQPLTWPSHISCDHLALVAGSPPHAILPPAPATFFAHVRALTAFWLPLDLLEALCPTLEALYVSGPSFPEAALTVVAPRLVVFACGPQYREPFGRPVDDAPLFRNVHTLLWPPAILDTRPYVSAKAFPALKTAFVTRDWRSPPMQIHLDFDLAIRRHHPNARIVAVNRWWWTSDFDLLDVLDKGEIVSKHPAYWPRGR